MNAIPLRMERTRFRGIVKGYSEKEVVSVRWLLMFTGTRNIKLRDNAWAFMPSVSKYL